MELSYRLINFSQLPIGLWLITYNLTEFDNTLPGLEPKSFLSLT